MALSSETPVPTALARATLPAAVGRHQAGHAEHRIRPEHQRIEEVVVDAAVDHVDALRPLGGAHVDDVVAHEEVATLDQLDAELVGEEGVLVVGRVERPRRHQRDGRLGRRGRRREAAQRRQQLVGIVLDGRDARLGEEVGEEPHHHVAVLQHVGDAGRRARIVLQDVEVLVVGPDDVDAGDLHVDVVRQLDAHHFRAERRVLVDEILRHDAGADDLGLGVDVGEEGVERGDALGQASREQRPFAGRSARAGRCRRG